MDRDNKKTLSDDSFGITNRVDLIGYHYFSNIKVLKGV